jgi:hypothetical protein
LVKYLDMGLTTRAYLVPSFRISEEKPLFTVVCLFVVKVKARRSVATLGLI